MVAAIVSGRAGIARCCPGFRRAQAKVSGSSGALRRYAGHPGVIFTPSMTPAHVSVHPITSCAMTGNYWHWREMKLLTPRQDALACALQSESRHQLSVVTGLYPQPAMDSVPIVAITGAGRRPKVIGSDAFQGHCDGLAEPFTGDRAWYQSRARSGPAPHYSGSVRIIPSTVARTRVD